MAVAVDYAGHDRGAAGVDHLRVAGILLRVTRPDPLDNAAVYEHAHAEAEGGRAPIGNRRIAIERAHTLTVLRASASRSVATSSGRISGMSCRDSYRTDLLHAPGALLFPRPHGGVIRRQPDE
jgi:hypothetical protein